MQAITTKYFGPGNYRGARIVATTEAGKKLTISYPYELSGEDVHRKAAVQLCRKMGWRGCETLVGGAIHGGGYAFLFMPSGCRCPERSFPKVGFDGLRRRSPRAKRR